MNDPADQLADTIKLYVHYPEKKKAVKPRKTVLMIGGLDHYRAGQSLTLDTLLPLNISVINVDMPGTGDAPINGKDPNADAAYWKAILDWIYANGEEKGFDLDDLWVYGTSTGSYWAIKLAYGSEKERIKGVFAQGGTTHYTFTRDWLESADKLAYPVDLWGPLASTFGYVGDHETFADIAGMYSLRDQGVLSSKPARLIGVNGVDDTVFPIDDYLLLAYNGTGAELRLFPGNGHMGEPGAGEFIGEFWSGFAQGLL